MIRGNHVTYLLTAYVEGELPRHLRQRVTRHVGVCDACYAALVSQQDSARSLSTEMPVFGAPQAEQLARLLPDILTDAAPPRRTAGARRMSGFGLAVIASLLLALFLPGLISPRVAAEFSANQPAPDMIAATATQSVTDAPLQVQVMPTAVARRIELATEPPDLAPPPAPVYDNPAN